MSNIDSNNNRLGLAIKQLNESDRPREKAKEKGFQALTDAELLAILIGSGSLKESVVDLCQRILADNDYKFNSLARRTIADLVNSYHGVGEVKAITILAALELGRRYEAEKPIENPQITSSQDIYNYLRPLMGHLDHEQMRIVTLSRSKRIIRSHIISEGGTSATVGDIKIILRAAINDLADAIILAHNHPSGNLTPSRNDNDLTRQIKTGCTAVGIQLLDHIIVTRSGYYSYLDSDNL